MTDVLTYLQPPALAIGWLLVVRSLITSLERVAIAYLNRPHRESEAAGARDAVKSSPRRNAKKKTRRGAKASAKSVSHGRSENKNSAP